MVVAKAAIDRVGWSPPAGVAVEVLAPEVMLPQVGQGALALECRSDDTVTRAALAAILYGDANPSGRLPNTLAANRDDYPDAGNFPGKNHQVNYAESIYVGYRHFDKAGIQPLFPFGFGLSYTKFDYKNLKLSDAQLAPDGSLVVTTTGQSRRTISLGDARVVRPGR